MLMGITILFKMPIFELKLNFLKFQRPIWLRILRELWPYQFLSVILILRGPNIEQFTHEIVVRRQIAIWDKIVPRIKELKNKTPITSKILGSVFTIFRLVA